MQTLLLQMLVVVPIAYLGSLKVLGLGDDHYLATREEGVGVVSRMTALRI